MTAPDYEHILAQPTRFIGGKMTAERRLIYFAHTGYDRFENWCRDEDVEQELVLRVVMDRSPFSWPLYIFVELRVHEAQDTRGVTTWQPNETTV